MYLHFYSYQWGETSWDIVSKAVLSIFLDLSKILCRSDVGLSIDDMSINHVFYAYDLYIMAPSPACLQKNSRYL